ncbi:Coenzyme F420 hydrogenase/dehydrogenase, beta subunit C-terminal domain [bacterium]|nr:Coenzyme F420 hydrogenase/dehydrogenase, beta subunit C-terminal domain [bacterium]
MNIEHVVEENLCIQCGMCSAVCPKACISIKRHNYDFLPEIDKIKCIDCSLCSKICSKNYLGSVEDESDINEEIVLGDYINIYHAKTKNRDILKSSTSGGIITTLVHSLLENNSYDCAFLLDKYSYDAQLRTSKFTKNDSLINTTKSRYLTVSHYNSVKYLKENPNDRVIIVGTGCVISSFLELINILKLNRDNYLLIGLFCDKTMNYGVYEYFKQHKAGKNKILKNLFFRTKDAGNWPGNVRLEYEDGSTIDLNKKERMKVKEYFVPERCLYCLDKLNKNADLSVGDNYIPENYDENGISSVIIRSKRADEIWNNLSDKFSFGSDSKEIIIKVQGLKSRINKNLQFAKIKGLAKGNYSAKDKNTYLKILRKIKLGQNKKLYTRINLDILFNKILSKLNKIFK